MSTMTETTLIELQKAIYGLGKQTFTVESLEPLTRLYEERVLLDKPIQYQHLEIASLEAGISKTFPKLILKDKITGDLLELFHPSAWSEFISHINFPKEAYIHPTESFCEELFADMLDYRIQNTRGSLVYRMIQVDNLYKVRAIVSSSYSTFNNNEFCAAFTELSQDVAIEKYEVTLDVNDLIIKGFSTLEFDVNPTMKDPITFSLFGQNGEGGDRSIEYGSHLFRQICSNGLIRTFDGHKTIHRGNAIGIRVREELAFAKKHAKLVPVALRNSARTLIDMTKDDLKKAITRFTKRAGLSEEIAESIYLQYLNNNDTPLSSLWRLVNALTFVAKNQNKPSELSLQDLACKIIYNPDKHFLVTKSYETLANITNVPSPITVDELRALGIRAEDFVKELDVENGKCFTEVGIDPLLVRQQLSNPLSAERFIQPLYTKRYQK